MTSPVITRRRAEQAAMVATARTWATALAERLSVDAVVVFGSVARGDFNKWSDIDVLVVSPALSAGARERLELLMADSPRGVQPVGWTPQELQERRDRRDPIAVECDTVGVVVWGRLDDSAESRGAAADGRGPL